MWKVWRNWLKKTIKPEPTNIMSKNFESIKSHASSDGRLYIKEEEFFRSEKVKNLIRLLLKSSIYQQIKERESSGRVQL